LISAAAASASSATPDRFASARDRRTHIANVHSKDLIRWMSRPAIRTGRCSDIDRSFENNSDMVSTPPCQLARDDRLKIVEGDEKIYRKKPESI
jgi:hypothetical protein